jgi:ribosomal protein S18 acetylase RimI-like enzyme
MRKTQTTYVVLKRVTNHRLITTQLGIQDMNIEAVDKITDSLLSEVNTLLPQLSSSAHLLDKETLRQIINSECCHLLIATENSKLLGMLTLVVFRIPTGQRAWIEDVVVDEATRGKGVGLKLVEAAINLAREKGAKTIDLTSRPAREAANRLYQKAGFKQRETNVYRFS